MKVFITGASGYIGAELALRLAEGGHTVHALVRTASSSRLPTHKNIKIFIGDILDLQSISTAMEGCQQVYHTAAFVQICARDRNKFYLHNVTGTEHVLQAALAQDIEKLVFTSSCGVWGVTGDHVFTEKDPRIAAYDNDYEVSKLMAEKLVLDYCTRGLHCVIVNPTKVFGFGKHHQPGKMNYNTFINAWFRRKIILLPWKMKVTSNLVFINDLVNGHLLAMKSGRAGERYILGGDNVSVSKVLNTIRELGGKRKYLIRVPQPVMYLWSLAELLVSNIQKRDPRIVPKMIGRLSQHAQYSSQLAVQELGYQITPFIEAMQMTMNDAKKFAV